MERGFLAMLGRCYPSRLANLEIRATDNDGIISILLLACIRWVLYISYTSFIPYKVVSFYLFFSVFSSV